MATFHRFDESTGKGEITYVGTDPNYKNKYDDILRGWGFDPKYYEIEGTVRTSSGKDNLKVVEQPPFLHLRGL